MSAALRAKLRVSRNAPTVAAFQFDALLAQNAPDLIGGNIGQLRGRTRAGRCAPCPAKTHPGARRRCAPGRAPQASHGTGPTPTARSRSRSLHRDVNRRPAEATPLQPFRANPKSVARIKTDGHFWARVGADHAPVCAIH
jgi:hypothetical protein